MNDLTNILGPEPNWKKCSCGELSSRVPCWECDRRSAQRADEARERAAAIVPPNFAWATLKSPELRDIVKLKEPFDVVVRRVNESKGNIVFTGQAGTGSSGTGKTFFASALLQERRPRGLYLSASQLGVARIQWPAGRGEAPVVESAMATPLLLIDEVGGESKTATSAMRDVLFHRYDRGLPLWITTGFSVNELEAFYGDGIVRRIFERALIVRFAA